MAKSKLSAGRISHKAVGYVESPADAHVMLEWARAHSPPYSSKPKELRVVISDEIAPCDAPEIIAILKIRGFESRSSDQVFTMAVAASPIEKDLAIAVLNPRVLFFKEKALKKLNDRYVKAFKTRQAARFRLKDIHAGLNRVVAELGATNSRIFELQCNIRTSLIIRAVARPPPLQLPQNITPDQLRLHHAFLIDPLFPEANPPVLKSAAAIAESIVEVRTSLGLPPAGGQMAVANLLTKLRAELAILIRRLVTMEMDKSVLLQDADMEETTISTLNDMMPRIRTLMQNKSVYGADGLDEEGRPGGQAPGGVAGGPGVGGVAGVPGDVGGTGVAPAGGTGVAPAGGAGGAPVPMVAST